LVHFKKWPEFGHFTLCHYAATFPDGIHVIPLSPGNGKYKRNLLVKIIVAIFVFLCPSARTLLRKSSTGYAHTTYQ